jgi:hypothetical protein
MGALPAIPAAASVWGAIQDVGQGVQHAAKSASAEAALHVFYEHESKQPVADIQEAESAGRIADDTGEMPRRPSLRATQGLMRCHRLPEGVCA